MQLYLLFKQKLNQSMWCSETLFGQSSIGRVRKWARWPCTMVKSSTAPISGVMISADVRFPPASYMLFTKTVYQETASLQHKNARRQQFQFPTDSNLKSGTIQWFIATQQWNVWSNFRSKENKLLLLNASQMCVRTRWWLNCDMITLQPLLSGEWCYILWCHLAQCSLVGNDMKLNHLNCVVCVDWDTMLAVLQLVSVNCWVVILHIPSILYTKTRDQQLLVVVTIIFHKHEVQNQNLLF